MPHACYQLAHLAWIQGDWALHAVLAEEALEAEKHRIPLFEPPGDTFPIRDIVVSNYNLYRQKHTRVAFGANKEVVCGHLSVPSGVLLGARVSEAWPKDKQAHM